MAYTGAEFPVPPLVLEAHAAWLAHVTGPGAWWTGEERVQFVDAVWAAFDDDDPLPPWVTPTLAGRAPSRGTLPPAGHDIAYRLARHAATTTEAWYRTSVEGLRAPPAAFVELVALAATAAAVDGFCRGMALARPALGDPRPGAPTRVVPELTAATLNWVPVRPPADERASVVQALDAVPEEFAIAWQMADAQYMPDHEMIDMNWQRGALHRRQMELVAAKVSLLRECFF